jgi:MinD-like ATPase involved in chromosome partitioning or flagellar assembly
MVAIAGICGGAGASTLAYLLGVVAARAPGDVLLCDADNSTEGISLYSGARSPRSLGQLVTAVAGGDPMHAPPFTTTNEGLRVIATEPLPAAAGRPGEDAAEHEADGVQRVLADARQAHALTVIDCGTLASRTSRLALHRASHIVWVVPASDSGAARGWRALSTTESQDVPELVVARRDHETTKPRMRPLAALADARGAPLVLMPRVDLIGGSREEAIATSQLTLDAIADWLRR